MNNPKTDGLLCHQKYFIQFQAKYESVKLAECLSTLHVYKFKASIFSTTESLEEKNEMAVLMIPKAIHVTHSSSVYERPAPCYIENREREPTSNPTPITYRVHPYSSAFYVSCPHTTYIPSQEPLYLIPLLLGYCTHSNTVFY